MVYKHLAPFDPDRDFVTLTFFRANGVAYARDHRFDKASIPARTLRMLYDNHKVGYDDATEAELAATLAPATIEDLGEGRFAVATPWSDEPEEVEGRDRAVLRAQQLRDAGEPANHHGVALVEGENGWWTVNPVWLAEPEKVHGEEAARARADELRAGGPPDDWVDPAMLVGSDKFEASYKIGGETVPLGDLVLAAQAASGHPVKVWNGLPPDQREPLIQAELDRRTKGGDVGGQPEQGGAGAGSAGEADRTGGAGATATVSVEDRVKALVDANTEDQLREKAEGLDGLGSAKNKTDIATLIVEAGRDQPPAEDESGGAS